MQHQDNNCGRIFEKKMYHQLSQIDGIDKIYDENELRKKYGWDSVGIDFLIIKDTKCIAIQTKYRKTRRREDDMIRKFIHSLEHVLKNTNLQYECGFWISRIQPFEDNELYMDRHNIKCIHEFHSMERLVNDSIKKIKDVILSHNLL